MFSRVISCLMAVAIVVAIAAPVMASSAPADGQNDINPLAPSAFKLDLALWTAVVFVVFMAILGKFAWKPIAEGLDKRERNVAEQIAQAEAANQKAADILADYQHKLAAAQDEVRAIIERGRRDADRAGSELIDKAKQEAEAEYQRAVKQIDAATNSAIKELAAQSATLAVELAGKIVQAKLNPSDHARLIEQAVAGFVHGKDHVSQN